MKKCKNCKGTGHTGVGRLGMIVCNICLGTGKVSNERAKRFREFAKTRSEWKKWK